MSLDYVDNSNANDLNGPQELNIKGTWETDTSFWNNPEINELYKSTLALNRELEELDRQRKEKVYRGLNLWYVQWDFSSMRRKMVNLYDKNSLEGILFNNSQIQNFFSIALSEQEKDWIRVNKEREEKKAKELNWDDLDQEAWEDIIESWDEYSLRETSPENFEKFLLSEAWLKILREEIDDHIDPNWNIYKNYPISKKVLQLKLRKAWFNTIREEYNDKYDIIMDNDKINIKKYWNIIANGVDVAVWDYLKSWGNERGDWLAWRLELLLLNERGNDIRLDMQEESVELDDFKVFLKESIRKYANDVLKRRKEWEKLQLLTWEVQTDLQLKAYLFMYGKFFYPQDFKNSWELLNYNENLLDIFEAILYFDGKLETVQNNKYIELERKSELARLERDRKRRVEIAKRNRERNGYLKSTKKITERIDNDELKSKSINPNDATWTEIASQADLNLKDYNLDIKENKEREQRTKEIAFREAYDNFIRNHDNIKELITIGLMRRLFDVNSNDINNSEWEEFKNNNPIFKEISPDEVKKIHDTLSGFSTYFTNAERNLRSNSYELKEKINETVKTHAIGAVIDNVRDTFSFITENQNWKSEWFQLDESEPVKQDWNDIIISGSFNGSDVEIRYNLESWNLLMKSLLHKDEINPNKFTIWEWYDIIWTIEPFNNVINNYYNLPPRHINNDRINNRPQLWKKPRWGDIIDNQRLTQNPNDDNLPYNRPSRQFPLWWHSWSLAPRIDKNDINNRREQAKKLLNSQIDLIGSLIKNKTESKAQINVSISKFMKTFNILPESSNYNSLDFNSWSNLFDIIQIIDNSGNIENGDIQSLEYFNNIFMPKIMKYSWLIWWKNNMKQDMTNLESEKLFNYKWNDENITYFKDIIKDFNPQQFSWENKTNDFNASHQLWLAWFITGGWESKNKINFVTGEKPNWILNRTKMENFLTKLETMNIEDSKEAKDNKENDEADKWLSGQLDNNFI